MPAGREGTPQRPESIAEPSTADQAEGHLDEDEPLARASHRREALGWRIRASEVELMLTHDRDLTKARAMLWRARRPAEPPVDTARGASPDQTPQHPLSQAQGVFSGPSPSHLATRHLDSHVGRLVPDLLASIVHLGGR